MTKVRTYIDESNAKRLLHVTLYERERPNEEDTLIYFLKFFYYIYIYRYILRFGKVQSIPKIDVSSNQPVVVVSSCSVTAFP